MSLLDRCPAPPDWRVDWDDLRASYPWVDALHACPQDPSFHAEGDVGIHTRMACQALAESPRFRELPEDDRRVVFAAVLLHDVAKPDCTRDEGDRITSRGHSHRGEVTARAMLWRMDVPFEAREQVCALVRYHQVPFFLVDRADSQRLAYAVSQVARCDLLSHVAWADGYGRRCADPADQQRILDNVELFRAYCAEHDCLEEPRAFPSDHSRFLYFQKEGRAPSYHAHDDTPCEVTLMCGLPGAGKDHWIRENAGGLPVVSLDALRAELGIDPDDSQGRVVDVARQRAKEHLRAERSFVWNATNLSRRIRARLIAMFAGYGARIRIVYVEAPEAELRARNAARAAPVPDRIVDRLLRRWTVPDLTEAHELVIARAVR